MKEGNHHVSDDIFQGNEPLISVAKVTRRRDVIPTQNGLHALPTQLSTIDDQSFDAFTVSPSTVGNFTGTAKTASIDELYLDAQASTITLPGGFLVGNQPLPDPNTQLVLALSC